MFSKLIGKVRIYTFFVTVLVSGACQQQLKPNLQQQRSKQGMAVSAHPLASAAGRALLQQGGNAVDAAAATALAAGIPGTVAGLYTVHREYGKLPWAQVVAPAIALAENGFPVSSRFTTAARRRLDALKKNRAAREVFTGGGILYQPGELLVQRDLARTLRQIAENPQSFYTAIRFS